MSLEYSVHGANTMKPIIFLHGGGMDSSVWNAHLTNFKNYQCFLVDLPGHGKNSNEEYFSFDDSIMEIEKLIVEINNDSHQKVNIVAHSLGAMLALHIIAKQNDAIASAIIASGNLKKALLYKIMASKSFLKLLNIFMKNKMDVDKASEISKQVIAILYFPETIGKVNTRVMFTQGSREPGFLKRSNRELHERLKNSEIYTFRKSGHLYPFEEVSAFDSLCIGWIEYRPS